MQLEENVRLAPFTTFHIGGSARFFVRVNSVEEARESFNFAKEKNLKVLVLGGGSNILIDDAGFDGLVIKIEIEGITLERGPQEETQDKILIVAGAGERWDALVERSVEEKLWGLENLSGIPGTVGGAVAGNIGAYGSALSQTLQWVEVFDRESGEVKKMGNDACAFGYRDSFFKHDAGEHVILHAAFALSAVGKPNLSYKDLLERFDDSSQNIESVREAVLEIRKGKFPDLTQEGTAGSFFKNPVLPLAQAEKLQKHYPTMPLFTLPESSGVKVPLAWLLDKALGLKGLAVGHARLFEKQPLVIVAGENCTAREVHELSLLVTEKVFDACGITLEPEVKIIF
jgi:UDP-N-acetylmuramate dehydrogenase